MPRILLYCSLTLALVVSARAGEVGEMPLRGSLIDKPHFNTALERQVHRFQGEHVNKYRLYDFYSRQAEYHVSAGNPPDRLLPYPGLEGGRRGHWGYTNERYSTAFERQVYPAFEVITGRGNHGMQYVKSGSSKHPAIITFDFKLNGLLTVMTDAKLSAPPSRFGAKIDRYGFKLSQEGTPWLRGPGKEWAITSAPPLRYEGYYVNGNNVVYRRGNDALQLLDLSQVHVSGSHAVLERTIEFLNPCQTATFQLPLPAKAFKTISETKRIGKNTIAIRSGNSYLVHQFHGTLNAEFKFSPKTPAASLTLTGIQENSRVGIRTCIVSSLGQLDFLDTLPPSPKPSTLISGGKSRFPERLITQGKLNADPSASGSAYEIDDVGVPFDNPYHIPMTLSGIDFDSKGNAYVSTVVGDVWYVTGLDRDLQRVAWKRYATGLSQALGLCVVDDVPYVSCKDQIAKLHDLNGDHEADYYERFNRVNLTSDNQRMGLQRDAQGNLYYSALSGIYKMSADGRKHQRIGVGSRNPMGLGVYEDGLAMSDSSEGGKNGTCSIHESNHPDNVHSAADYKRILYVPRGIDNSPGGRRRLNDPRFGPLGNSFMGVSFGRGTSYILLRDANEGHPQAALMPLPGEFASGTCRLMTNPVDGQLYTVGLDGWGDYAVREGCFHRLRYTGEKCLVPTGWQAHKNGMLIRFNTKLDPSHLDASQFFVQQWNYINSRSYGSPEYSVISPEELGHDYLPVDAVRVLDDQRSLFIAIPSLLPAMSTHVYTRLKAQDGSALKLNLFATINRLRPDHGAFEPARDKVMTLTVPTRKINGDTYQVLVEHFDKVAGRASFKRPVVEAVSYDPGDLNYAWIDHHIVQKQCILCHMKGKQHDLSTYEGLTARLNRRTPRKSHLHGMVSTHSMPPYPLPTVHPKMQVALLEWIKAGAPKGDSLLKDKSGEAGTLKVRGEATEGRLASAEPMPVTQVWMCGQFADPEASGRDQHDLDRKHPPETGAVDVTASYGDGPDQIRWKKLSSQNGDYSSHVQSTGSPQSVYALFYIDSPANQQFRLELATDGAAKVWRNGKPVWHRARRGKDKSTAGKVSLDLVSGTNQILVRCQPGEQHMLALHVRALDRIAMSIPEPENASLAERLKTAAQGQSPVNRDDFLNVDWNKVATEGNIDNGRILFVSTGCVKCHAVPGSVGVTGGPSLMDVGRRFTLDYLVESVLLPSQKVSTFFRSSTIVTVDGKVVTGLITAETDTEVVLVLPDATRLPFAKDDIEERVPSSVSAMPQGLVKSPDELKDILSFLLSIQ